MKSDERENINSRILGILYKKYNLIDKDNNIYLFYLWCIVMLLCITLKTFYVWLVMLIVLIVFWMYNVIVILVSNYHNNKLKELNRELYEETGNSIEVKSLNGFFLVNFIMMMIITLLSVIIYLNQTR